MIKEKELKKKKVAKKVKNEQIHGEDQNIEEIKGARILVQEEKSIETIPN